MRHPDARSHFDAAVSNVESALKDLTDRLDDVLPGNNRRRQLSRAGRAIRRTASSVADRVTPGHRSSMVADARQAVRDHPVQVALTAALAGYCLWSLFRLGNGRPILPGNGRTLADRYRSSQEEGILRH
jgi:hypothetical protein